MRARHSLSRLSAAARSMVVAAAGWAFATTPQTIVIDGVNDFLPANLVDADGGDTQFPNIDLGDTLRHQRRREPVPGVDPESGRLERAP